jgi:flagellar L-ring protein precursor FlgH
MNRKAMVGGSMVLAMLVSVAAPAAAAADERGDEKTNKTKQGSAAADTYDALYARYLQAARMPTAPDTPARDISWMSGLSNDHRARRVNDLVTIRVIERISATGSADSSLDKASSGSASVTKLFGLEGQLPSSVDPTDLVAASAGTKFKGAGTTSRSSDLTAIVTARVVEVLPNGDLVLEGAREIDINGDRQLAVLTGVLRTADIAPNNVALSSSVGQLRIRYFGRGLIKDNLEPGWLIKILNKIF